MKEAKNFIDVSDFQGMVEFFYNNELYRLEKQDNAVIIYRKINQNLIFMGFLKSRLPRTSKTIEKFFVDYKDAYNSWDN